MTAKKPPVHTTGQIVISDKNNNMISCDFNEAQKKVNNGWIVKINKSGKKLLKQKKAKK